MPPDLNLNWIDKAILAVAPGWGATRMAARLAVRDAADFRASYRGGMTTRLDTSVPSSLGTSGINHPLRGQILNKLRDRSRNLDRNNALASSLLDRAVENVIGSGLRLQARTSDVAWNALAEKRFEKWVDEADVRELQSFYDIQQLLYRTQLREGDVGCVLADRGDGFPVLQPIEGDRIENAPGKNKTAIDGIGWSRVGRANKFYVKTDTDATGLRSNYEAVPARDFVYLMRMKRFSQVRGEPVFAQTFWLFDHLDGYVEAVVAAARAGACQAILVKRKGAANAYAGIGARAKDARGQERKAFKLEPLSVNFLEPDEDVQGFNPTQPTQNFGDFLAALARLMGLNLGLTLEQVMLDFSRVNYSSSRAARLQADATALVERDRFVRRFLRRVYQWWVSKMVVIGELPAPPDDFWAHEWIGDARPWVDPEKELKAALIELDMGLTTLAILAKERGREFVELVLARQAEIELAREAGVPVVMSNQTRDLGQAPASQAQPPGAGANPSEGDPPADPEDDPATTEENL